MLCLLFSFSVFQEILGDCLKALRLKMSLIILLFIFQNFEKIKVTI